jgi:hypothetical protein
MASLNASGISVVAKQSLSTLSYGEKVAKVTNSNPYGQNSTRAITSGTPYYARSLAELGTQPTVPSGSIMHLGDVVKVTDDIENVTVERHLGGVPITSGNQPEVSLFNISTRHHHHAGNKIVQQDTDQDSVLARASNSGTTPGGEI